MATQQSSQEGPSEAIDLGLSTIFDYEELQEATNFFNPSEVVGRGGFGVVYRGKLSDGRAVAIKELTVLHQKRIDQFFNEVRLLSRLDHENLIRLYGCTNPEDEKMLLVYELMPNGSASDHLHHRQLSKKAFTWSQRLQIAIQTAEALTYLHSLQPAIIHRDIKTDNILLDDNFNAKVADFGSCRLLSLWGAPVSTMPQGTQGYLDPEYHQRYRLTTKSDVYSFGVVLMELISGKAVLDEERDDDEVWLVNMTFNKMKNDLLEQLVDPELGYLEDPDIFYMVKSVAQLACQCLQPRGHKRPHMVDVLKSLKEIINHCSAAFGYEEIRVATKLFKSSEWVDRCDFGKEYRGKLRDGRDVIIKKLNLSSHKKDIQQFLDDVSLISQHPHKNLVNFYGRTNFKDEKIFLVHEFMPNGTVADHLHRKRFPKKKFTWSQRLQIAIETAEALNYLHSFQPPIIHRNVKTDNIVLDNSFNAKVVDFGLCNLLAPWDNMQGYADPEYNQTCKLTAQSDVYSFGIVLVELISGKGILNYGSILDYHRLLYQVKVGESSLDQIVDTELGYSEDPIVFNAVNSVAQLANECLDIEGYARPDMVNVLKSLKVIRDAYASSS